MKKLIAILILAFSAAGLLAQNGPPAERPAPNGLGLGMFNNRVDISTLPTELQDMINQFREQRTTFLQERKALFEELKNMTQEQRRARIQELRTQTRLALEAQRELARQIRQELRNLRQERRNNPGG